MADTPNFSRLETVAERRILRRIISNFNVISEKSITEDTFTSECGKEAFNAIVQTKEKGISITKNDVCETALSISQKAITQSFIESIFDIEDDGSEIDGSIKNLADISKSYSILKNIDKLKDLITANPIRDSIATEKIINHLALIDKEVVPIGMKKRIKTMTDVAQEYLEEFESRKNGKKFKFYDEILDKAITLGPAPGSGGLIAASTGMGKSAFCLGIVDRFIQNDVPVMYYSLEMAEIDTFDRLMAKETNIDIEDIIQPKNIDDFITYKEEIKNNFDKLKKHKYFRFSETAEITLAQMRQDIKKFQQDLMQEIDNTYCVVIIDLLSMIKDFTITRDGTNFAQGIEVAINNLNAMAKDLGFHYIAVLQMNRNSEHEGKVECLDDLNNFRPQRTQIKNSNAFLERVRWAISLFRPKYFAEQYMDDESLYQDLPDYCEVHMLKQNQGKVGLIGKYLFDYSHMSMMPVITGDDDEAS